jgi:transcriptional regulator with XRE-family HTH domain
MKEHNKVIDEETRELIAPGEMIKRLMKRAGMKRNQLHEEMKKYMPTQRPIGEPSRLSDIFSGKHRTLPLVDLKPLMDAIKMPESLRDFYICEILKGYLPKQLAPYISSKRINKRNMLNILLIDDLKAQNRTLAMENQYLKNFGDESQHSPSPNPNDYDLRMNEFSDIDDYVADVQEWEDKKMSGEFDLEISGESAFEANIAYKKEQELWAKAIQEIEHNQSNEEFLHFIKLLFPNDFQELLFEFFECDQQPKDMYAKEQWAWVRGKISCRSLTFVCGDLFMFWKSKNPEAFAIYEKYYNEKFISNKYTKLPDLKYDEISFSYYLYKIWTKFYKSCPALYLLMSPWHGQKSINTTQDEQNTFLEYFEFIDSGWSKKINFKQRYELSSPSAVFDPLFIKKLRAVVIGCVNIVEIDEEDCSRLKYSYFGKKQALSNIYEHFDDLNLKYETCLMFLNKKLQSCETVDDAIRRTGKLISTYSKKQISQLVKNRILKIEELADSIEVSKYNTDKTIKDFLF